MTTMQSTEEKVEIINEALMLGLSCRVKLRHEPILDKWSGYLNIPESGYVEPSAYGPYPMRDLEYVLVDPIEQRYIGRLVPDRIIDHTQQVISLFEAEGLQYEKPDLYFKVNF